MAAPLWMKTSSTESNEFQNNSNGRYQQVAHLMCQFQGQLAIAQGQSVDADVSLLCCIWVHKDDGASRSSVICDVDALQLWMNYMSES